MSSTILTSERGGKTDDESSRSSDGEDNTGAEDVLHHEYEPLEESVYGWAVSMIVRDIVWLNVGTSVPMGRAARVIDALLVVIGTILLQVFLLLAVSRLLSAPAVASIREVYGEYEMLMYPNHTQLTVNGFARGVPGYMQEERFLLMKNETAKTVCQIPLSHPWYLMSIIFIWTMTCQVELRTIFESAVRLLWVTPIVRSASEVIRSEEEEEGAVHVDGLTCLMKVVIGFLVLLPRTMTLLSLLWLGGRWLTATLGLGDVLLNGLALEFLVILKELLYNVCISHRTRVDTQRLLVKPFLETDQATFSSFFEGKVWGILSAAWAVLYVYQFQLVLPDYRWDLRVPCGKYIPVGPLM